MRLRGFSHERPLGPAVKAHSTEVGCVSIAGPFFVFVHHFVDVGKKVNTHPESGPESPTHHGAESHGRRARMTPKASADWWRLVDYAIRILTPIALGVSGYLLTGHIDHEIRLTKIEANRWTAEDAHQDKQEIVDRLDSKLSTMSKDIQSIKEAVIRFEAKQEHRN